MNVGHIGAGNNAASAAIAAKQHVEYTSYSQTSTPTDFGGRTQKLKRTNESLE